ncbi:MAG: hypothetical protein JW871_09010 [Endomicrobiales bacterium]|nr:hypothetical protein [Endomicrobiales bacterium]
METKDLRLYFYGITVKITSFEGIINKLDKDFSYFKNAEISENLAKGEITLFFYNSKPSFEEIPDKKYTFKYLDLKIYDNRNIRFINYNEKALSIYDYQKEKGEVYCNDENLLHELAYLLVHSRVGEILDRHGIHRIHALGVSVNSKGLICLLPQHGGKTTLALNLLKYDGVSLISDDTPLTTRKGKILPFPVRIGINEKDRVDIPDKYKTRFLRRKHGAKILIGIDYFMDKLSHGASDIILAKGERAEEEGGKIIPINKLRILLPLIENCVIGVGLPQMLEYFLRLNVAGIIDKFKIMCSRLIACINLACRSKTYKFMIGTDGNKNASEVMKLLKPEDACA